MRSLAQGREWKVTWGNIKTIQPKRLLACIFSFFWETFHQTHHTSHHCYRWSLAQMEAPAHQHTMCSVDPLQGSHNHTAWLPIQTFYCVLQKLHFMLNNVPHQHHQPLPRCFPLLLPENLTVFWTLPPSLGHAPIRLKARGKASSRLYCQLQTLFLDPPAPLGSFLSLTSSQMLPPDTPAHFPWFTAVLLTNLASYTLWPDAVFPAPLCHSLYCTEVPFWKWSILRISLHLMSAAQSHCGHSDLSLISSSSSEYLPFSVSMLFSTASQLLWEKPGWSFADMASHQKMPFLPHEESTSQSTMLHLLIFCSFLLSCLVIAGS